MEFSLFLDSFKTQKALYSKAVKLKLLEIYSTPYPQSAIFGWLSVFNKTFFPRQLDVYGGGLLYWHALIILTLQCIDAIKYTYTSYDMGKINNT